MGFVNRLLDEDERREYVLSYPIVGKRAKLAGGTINDEENIRLFSYANERTGKTDRPEEWEIGIKYFLYDYKGKIYYLRLRQTFTNGNDIHWKFPFVGDGNELGEEEISSLREAMKVYAYHGFSMFEWDKEKKCRRDNSENDNCTVYIEF